MYRAILVPLDGSPFGEHALPLALDVARRSGAALHLVHAHAPEERRADVAALDAQRREQERAYLAAVAGRLAATWRGANATALLDGPRAEAIAAYAAAERIDLAALTTHGRGALSRAWLGSTADQLIHRLPVPMLVVRPHEERLADIASPPGLAHVLIPLDGSELAEGVIPHALALGRLCDAAYTLLQVVEIPVMDYGYGLSPLSALDVDAWIREDERYLERLAAPLRAEGLRVTTKVTVGWPAASILEYAQDHAADLIALATHSRSGAARLFLGSVADKIVRSAAVPVLLHRPPAEAAAL